MCLIVKEKSLKKIKYLHSLTFLCTHLNNAADHILYYKYV